MPADPGGLPRHWVPRYVHGFHAVEIELERRLKIGETSTAPQIIVDY